MGQPKVVAMISLYKSGKWLRQRFDNLMQTKTWRRGDLLIYATNAESPDEADHSISLEYTVHRNFKYDRIADCSVYQTWAHIIRATNTEYITNANADDLIAPNAYDIMIEACEKSNAHLAYCGWHTIGEEVKHWGQITGPGNPLSGFDPSRDLMSCGHFPLWSRKLHEKIGNFDGSFRAAGDADFWMRAWVNNIRDFVPVNMPLGGYRWRDGDNLWHRTAEDIRTREWATIHSRKPGRLFWD